MSATAKVLPDPDAMIWSVPERQRAGRPLLVLLHGHGGVAEDMTPFFDALPDDLVVVSVRGPVPLGSRWTWFDFHHQPIERFDAAAAGLLTWLDSLPDVPEVGVGGFSQGGAMALQLLRHRPRQFRYAIQLCGFVMPGRHSGEAEPATVRPPVLSINGGKDDVIAAADLEYTAHWLQRHAQVTTWDRPDLAHELTDEVVADTARYVAAQRG